MAFSEYQKQVVNGIGKVVDNTKSLGTIKTPSKTNQSSEIQEESLSYLAATSGLIAALLVGPNAARSILSDPNNTRNIIGKLNGKDIFSSINDIKKSIKQETNTIDSSLKEINKQLNVVNDITGSNIVKSLSDIKNIISDKINSFDSIINREDNDNFIQYVIDSLDIFKTKLDDLNNNITNLLNSTNSNLASAINNINTKNTIDINISNVEQLIDFINSIQNFQNKSEDILKFLVNFKKLINVIENLDSIKDPKKISGKFQDIISVFNNINKHLFSELRQFSENTNGIDFKSLEHIDKFFLFIDKTGEVGIKRALKFRNGIFFISNLIMSSVQDFYEKLSSINIEENKQKILNNIVLSIKEIINTLNELSKIGLFKILFASAKFNLIAATLKDSIESFIKTLESVSTGDKEKEILYNITSYIYEIRDLLEKFNDELSIDIRLVKRNLSLISNLLYNEKDTSLYNIFLSFNQLVEKNKITSKQFEDVKSTLNYIFKLFEVLPTLTSLLVVELKTVLLTDIIDNKLNKLISSINSIEKLNNRTATLKNIETTILYISHLFDILPNIKTIESSIKKIKAVLNSQEYINNIVSNINDLKTINKTSKYWQNLISQVHNIQNILTIFKNFEHIDNKDIDYTLNTIDGLNAFNTIVNSLPQIINDVEFYKEQTEKLSAIKPLIECLGLLFDTLRKVENIDAVKLDLDEITTFLLDLSEDALLGSHIEDIISINNSDIEKIFKVSIFIDNVISLASSMSKLDATATFIKDPKNSGLVKVAEVLKNTYEKFKEIEIDEKQLNKIKELSKTLLTIIGGCAAILLLAGLALTIIPVANVMLFAVVLNMFIKSIVNTLSSNAKSIIEAQPIANTFLELVKISAGALIIGGAVMNLVGWQDIATFATIELLFVTGLTYVYYKFSKEIQESKDISKNFVDLVLISSLVLVLGSLISKFVKLSDIALFVTAETLFVAGLLLVYAKTGNSIKNSIAVSEDFLTLVGISGLILVLGSIVSSMINIVGLIAFTAMLSTFVFTMVGIFYLINKTGMMNIAISGTREFAELIAICGLVLIAGSMLSKFVQFSDLLKFAFNLGLFMMMLTVPLIFMKGIVGIAEKTAKEFSKIVLLAGAVLILGAVVFKYFPDLVEKSLLFAGIFGTFMLMISGSLFIIGKAFNTKKMSLNLIVFTGCIILMGASLLYAANFINERPDILKNALLFIGTFALFALGISVVCRILQNSWMEILIGALVVAGISALNLLVIYSLKQIYDFSNEVEWLSLLNGIAKFGVGLLLVGTIYAGFGFLAGYVFPFLLVAGIVILGIAYLNKKIVDSFIYIDKNQHYFNTKGIEKFKGAIEAFSEIANVMIDKFCSLKMILKLPVVLKRIKSLSYVISSVATAIKDYASLKVAIYDESGKFAGYRSLTSSDFVEASNNIETVIVTIGNAIMRAYTNNPEIFKSNLFGNTPFGKVARAFKNIGPLISSISKAVKDYATFSIPEYNGTKITGYRKLTKEDFTNASNNIKEVIEVLGQTIIDVYKSNPEMFDSNFWGNTPFGKTVRALENMGSIISDISKAVKDYASLQIPIYEGTKITGYRKLTEEDFTNAATNVSKVVTSLGAAIIKAYNDNPEMFDGDIMGNTAFGNTSRALKEMGAMMSEISNAVNTYATNRFPVYKDGKIVSYVTPNYAKVGENVASIITALGNAIINTYSAHPELFDESNGIFGIGAKKSKFSVMVQGTLELAQTIGTITEAVKNIALMKMPIEFNDKGQPTKWVQVNKSLINNNIKPVIESIFTALVNPVNNLLNNKKLIKTLETITKDKGGKASLLLNANIKLANIIAKLAKYIQSTSKLQLPDPAILINLKTNLEKSLENMALIANIFTKNAPENFNNFFKNISSNEFTGLSLFTKNLYDLNKELTKLNNTIDFSEEIGLEGYDNISNGLENIYENTTKITENDKFRQHTDILERYVRTVNKINTQKLDKLTSLTNAMNILATKMGNVDKFTEVLAENITQVLDKLTKELKVSKETIEKAEKIQEKRHKLIRESIKSVKEIMDDPLRVEIRKVDDTDNLQDNKTPTGSNIPSYSDSSKSTTSTGGGSSTTSLSDAGGTNEIVASTNTTNIPNSNSNSNTPKKSNIPSNANAEAQYKNILNEIYAKVTSNGRMLSSIDDKLVNKDGISKSAS